MATTYEFVVETLEFYPGCGDDPEIIDCCFFPSLHEAEDFAKGCEEPWRIALVRDTGDDINGLTSRYYAYPNDEGKLQDVMETCSGAEDGPNTPARFKRLVFPVCR